MPPFKELNRYLIGFDGLYYRTEASQNRFLRWLCVASVLSIYIQPSAPNNLLAEHFINFDWFVRRSHRTRLSNAGLLFLRCVPTDKYTGLMNRDYQSDAKLFLSEPIMWIIMLKIRVFFPHTSRFYFCCHFRCWTENRFSSYQRNCLNGIRMRTLPSALM